MQNTNARTALLAISTHCPSCPAVLQALSEMVKAGELASLEIINLEADPDRATALGIRSVPWVRLGEVELAGLRSQQEYRDWLNKADHDAQRESIAEMLAEGDVDHVLQRVSDDSGLLEHLLALMADGSERINVRLGIGVIMEELAASEIFTPYIEHLLKLASSEDARVRADAAHYLGLTADKNVISVLQSMQEDDDAEVREVVTDSLAMLTGEED